MRLGGIAAELADNWGERGVSGADTSVTRPLSPRIRGGTCEP
ncbi:hypothetical protein RGUI_3319 [Rhodovulum sp. P5]|nr:hypothetical protein RGUI_3319 [Rhodovulum sp. P5]